MPPPNKMATPCVASRPVSVCRQIPGYIPYTASVYIVWGKRREAYEALQPLLAGPTIGAWEGLFGAILADELGNTDERNRILAAIVERADESRKASRRLDTSLNNAQLKSAIELAKLYQSAVAASPPRGKLDLKQLDMVIAALTPAERVPVEFFAGKLLEKFGEPNEAKKHYEVAMKGYPRYYLSVLASMRHRGIP